MNNLAQICFGGTWFRGGSRCHTGKNQTAERILAMEVVQSVMMGLIHREMEKNVGFVVELKGSC